MSINILVVDDDPSMRALLEISFSVEPDVHEVRTAEDGPTAIEVCRSFQPNVIITDVMLPKMSAEEATGLIRRLHPDASVLAFTGMDGDFDWADAMVSKGSFGVMDELRSKVLGPSFSES